MESSPWFTLEDVLVSHKSFQDACSQLLKGLVGGGKQGVLPRLTQLVEQAGGSGHILEGDVM